MVNTGSAALALLVANGAAIRPPASVMAVVAAMPTFLRVLVCAEKLTDPPDDMCMIIWGSGRLDSAKQFFGAGQGVS